MTPTHSPRPSQPLTKRTSRVRAGKFWLAAGILTLVVGGVATSVSAVSHAKHKGVEVSTLKTSKYGTILVSGTTLYTLTPSATPCTAACQKYWPELVLPKGATKATAGAGVDASKLGTISRSGGIFQVTYDGKPLYKFAFDKALGQVNGNVTDTWGKWKDVVTVKPAATKPTTSTTSTTTTKPTTTTTTTNTPTTTTRPTTTTTAAPSGGGVGF